MQDAKIMIVEDEFFVAKDIQTTLEKYGFTICGIFATGEEALVQIGLLKPSLVLMDIRLDGKMDGITAAKKIISTMDIPVIYLTGHSDDDYLARLTATNPYGYILKPYEEKLLKTTIEISLCRHNMEKALKQSEKRFHDTVDFLPTIVCEFDCDFNLLYINKLGYTIFDIEMDCDLSEYNLIGNMFHTDEVKRFREDTNSINDDKDLISTGYRFVDKSGSPFDTLTNISGIYTNDCLMGYRTSMVVVKKTMVSAILPDKTFFDKYNISKREKEIIRHLIKGESISVIGKRLFISHKTVKKHVSNIYEKFSINSKQKLFDIIKVYQKERLGYETFIFSILNSLFGEDVE